MLGILIKLRLSVPRHELAFKFGVSQSTVSRTFAHWLWLCVMDARLPFLQGARSFVLQAWEFEGRTSDKHLTKHCSLLDKLAVPGDLVMAERGTFHHPRWCCPQASREKPARPNRYVEKTRGIASVRIHVEQVIGLLSGKYTILHTEYFADRFFNIS